MKGKYFQDVEIQRSVASVLNNMATMNFKKRFETLYERCEMF